MKEQNPTPVAPSKPGLTNDDLYRLIRDNAYNKAVLDVIDVLLEKQMIGAVETIMKLYKK